MRALHFALVALLAAALAGCFTFRSTITVRPDGSGTIVERTTLSGPALAALADDPEALYSEAALSARATALGPGVAFVGASEDSAGAVQTATYTFADVSALAYRLPSNASSPETLAAEAATPPLATFGFERGPDASTLRVVVVPEPPDGLSAPTETTDDAHTRLDFLRVLFGGATLAVEVVAGSEMVETDATYTDGQTTTLMDIAFGDLFDVVEAHPELMTRAIPPLGEIGRLADGRAGLRVQPPGTVTVRFR